MDVLIMGVSARIIRVLDGQYTLELELEVDDPNELLVELCKTTWGKKLAYLLSKMLPDVPEIKTEDQQTMLEEEEKRLKEHEESLIEKGRREIMNKYFNKSYEDIKKQATKEAEKKMRKKYMTYIRKTHLKKEDKAEGCFGKYDPSTVKCQECASREECRKYKKPKEVVNHVIHDSEMVVSSNSSRRRTIF